MHVDLTRFVFKLLLINSISNPILFEKCVRKKNKLISILFKKSNAGFILYISITITYINTSITTLGELLNVMQWLITVHCQLKWLAKLMQFLKCIYIIWFILHRNSITNTKGSQFCIKTIPRFLTVLVCVRCGYKWGLWGCVCVCVCVVWVGVCVCLWWVWKRFRVVHLRGPYCRSKKFRFLWNQICYSPQSTDSGTEKIIWIGHTVAEILNVKVQEINNFGNNFLFLYFFLNPVANMEANYVCMK